VLAIQPSVYSMSTSRQDVELNKSYMRPSATMTSVKNNVRGSSFAREGFSKKNEKADQRDFMLKPTSSFGVPAIPPKRTRPRTAKVKISVKPRKPIRSNRVRSRSAKSKKEDKNKENKDAFKDGKINADLNFDIEVLEKKRNETKKELKSLLK
jgi:patatin-like phospholipase/acyl hydrolase